MRYKHYVLYLALGLVMIQYQNCAPSADPLQAGADTSVDVIDQINVGAISFPQEKVSAYLDQSLSVIGTCDQSGSLISWKLHDSDGEFIERGLAECDLGSFEVELSDQWQNYCGETLKLSAQLGAKSTSEASVEAVCQ